MRDYASLYSELLDDLVLNDKDLGPVYSDMDPGLVSRRALASSFYKKLCPKGNTADADDAALKKFLAINASYADRPFVFGAENEAESCFYDAFKAILNSALEPHESYGSFDLDFIGENLKIGSGASQLADVSSFHSKLFEGEMSYSKGSEYLISVYRAAIVGSGLWADAEMHRFQRFGFTAVRGGKIFFAPKNREISRTCCTEPLLNSLFQQAIGAFYELRLQLFFNISLSTQPDFNRELARIGSIDGSFGTIDLVSASDSNWLKMLDEVLMPSKLKAMMWLSRCKSAILPNGKELKLEMISTMGNAFTFPLQTMIFASAVKACYSIMGFPCTSAKTEYGVFGDDIVVRKEVYEFLVRMLTKLGYQVNVGKSFNTGLFRESCGEDYYSGVNVRGVYIKSLETSPQVYSAINRLNRWSANNGWLLPKTMTLLLSWAKTILVPPSEADDSGIHVPFKLTKPRLTDSYWFKYRKMKRIRRSRKQAEPDEYMPNPYGLGVSILGGYTRRPDFSYTQPDDSPWKHGWSLQITMRDKPGARPGYQIVNQSIPYWDFWPSEHWSEETLHGFKLEGRRTRNRTSQRLWEEVLVAVISLRN